MDKTHKKSYQIILLYYDYNNLLASLMIELILIRLIEQEVTATYNEKATVEVCYSTK